MAHLADSPSTSSRQDQELPSISIRQDITESSTQYHLEVEYQDDVSSESRYSASDHELGEREEPVAPTDSAGPDVEAEAAQDLSKDGAGGFAQGPETSSLTSHLRLRKPVYSSDEEDNDHWEGDHHGELSHLSQSSLHGEEDMFKRQDRGPVIPFHVDGDDKYGKLPLSGRTQVRKEGSRD